MAFAGLAPDLFAGDAAALSAFRTAFYKEVRFDPDVFRSRHNFSLGAMWLLLSSNFQAN
jgi:hypothetical protein